METLKLSNTSIAHYEALLHHNASFIIIIVRSRPHDSYRCQRNGLASGNVRKYLTNYNCLCFYSITLIVLRVHKIILYRKITKIPSFG